jgi:hypothetical protein
VTELPVGYAGLAGDLSRPLAPVEAGQVLLGAAGERYQRVCTHCSVVQFTQSGQRTYSTSPAPWTQGKRTARWQPGPLRLLL